MNSFMSCGFVSALSEDGTCTGLKIISLNISVEHKSVVVVSIGIFCLVLHSWYCSALPRVIQIQHKRIDCRNKYCMIDLWRGEDISTWRCAIDEIAPSVEMLVLVLTVLDPSGTEKKHELSAYRLIDWLTFKWMIYQMDFNIPVLDDITYSMWSRS